MGTLKYAILGLLNRNEMTGYELSKEFETTLFEFWNAKHSQIYPELKSLNAEGLIQYRWKSREMCWRRRSIRSPMKDGAIFGMGRNALPDPDGSKDESRLRLFFLDGASPDFSSVFLPTSFPSIRSIWNICWKTRKSLMKSLPQMTARFRIISSCAARCTGKKLHCSGFRNASNLVSSGLRN